MSKDITIEDVLAMPDAVIVDVRSEGEFCEDTIPGAVNIPLLNNLERALVGTAYKNESPVKARRLGLDLVSPKLPGMLKEYELQLSRGNGIVLFCWRGGLRSQFVAYMLDLMGFEVYRINGGYKAYRKYVNSYLEGDLPQRAVVLHGLTGVGKTDLLHGLAEKGIPVLDLEGLARHRGSVFGKIGLEASPSQKNFEGLIVESLRQAEQKGIFVVECESRRLGKLLVPQTVMKAMKKGYGILLYASIQHRIRRSVMEYVNGPGFDVQSLIVAVESISKYLGKVKAEKLIALLSEGRYEEAVDILLVDYYDPLYKYPSGPDSSYDLSVDTGNLDSAVETVAGYITGLPEYGVPVGGGVWLGNRKGVEGRQRNKGSLAGCCGK